MLSVLTEADNLLNDNQPQTEIVNTQVKSKKSINARTVLWHVTFWGFVVNYMVRCNINMAIISMVVPRGPTNRSEVKVSECFNHSSVSLQNTTFSNNDVTQGGFRIERNIMDFFNVILLFREVFSRRIQLLKSRSFTGELQSRWI